MPDVKPEQERDADICWRRAGERPHRPRQLPTTGFGIHGDTKYNRRKKKAEDRRIIRDGDGY